MAEVHSPSIDEQSTVTNTDTQTDQKQAQTVCPECGGSLRTDDEHGETVCEECSLVVEENSIDHGPEWRAFNSQENNKKSRVGAPTTKLMHDKGLSSVIDTQNKDAYGNALNARQRQKMQRLRTWDERFRTRDHKERNLRQAIGEIERMGSALGLSETVRETASVIYRRALKEDLLPGRSIEGVASAAIYAAARQAGTPRRITRVVNTSRIDELEFKRTYRYIVRELGLEIEPADPESYVGRFASELGLSDAAERDARDLLKTAKDQLVHVGKSPVGLAAAAVYAAPLLHDEKITQAAVSEVTDISEVTIRNRYQELLDAAEKSKSP